MKTHMRQSSNCVFAQELNITFKETSIAISVIALIDSTSTKSASINCIAFSSQIFYLIIKYLYHKQKTLLAKIEEKSTINFNSSSTSTKSSFEFVIQLNVILVASSILTSISKNSKMISSRLISFCSTSTILLINQSNYLFVANQFVAHISYQHIVMTFFFNYEKWFHISFTSKTLIQAEFRYTFTRLSLNCITCRQCDLILENWKLHNDFIKEHLHRSFECFKAKRTIEQEIFIVVQEIMKQEVVVAEKTVEQAVIETIKSEIINLKKIDFLDFIMQVDLWKKFRISINSASFLYHLIEFAVKYKKKSILKILFRCLRDSALQWLKNQLKFTSLNDFKLVITKIFSFVEFVANFDQVIINSSSRFHRCFECDVEFSSTSRLLTHTQKNCFKNFTCKHCEKIFASNNKFHEHVRLYHIRKSYSNKTSRQRFVEKENNHINSSISRFIFSITFKSMTASTKLSYLFISMTKAFVACFLISSSNLFRISILSHITSKIYMFINDLFEIFVEISNRKSRNIMQKKSTSSCFFEFRQIRIKSLCQQNFKDTIMLAKKQFRRNLNAIRKRMRFSLSSMFNQIQIINYFKFVNQSNFTSIKSIKFSIFINCFNSTLRICFSINQDARISHIALETNFTSLIKSRIKTRASIDWLKSKYLVVADVDHSIKNIRVETSLTNAKKYNSIKSSIKRFKSFKSVVSINSLNSTSRFCSSVNQITEISQHQYIAIDEISSLKT